MDAERHVAVHWGAGNIGRGFIADLYQDSRYEIVFLDVHEDTTARLKKSKSYTIHQVEGDEDTERVIENYMMIHSKNEEGAAHDAIDRADILTCSVGPGTLEKIAPLIAGGINRRDIANGNKAPLAIIACENMLNATDCLKKHIMEHLTPEAKRNLDKKAEFANCAIDRIVPSQEADLGLDVKIEKFFEWCVEETPFKHSGPPKVKGIHWVKDLQPFLQRKLFTVNTGHATTAYLGYQAGIDKIHDALADPKIRAAVLKALSQTATYIVQNLGIPQAEQDAYIQRIITRFQNSALDDDCARVGRDPLRKLGADERYIKPASKLAESKLPYDGLLVGMEAALKFQIVDKGKNEGVPGDKSSGKMVEILRRCSASDATQKITGLKTNHPLFADVERVINNVQGWMKEQVQRQGKGQGHGRGSGRGAAQGRGQAGSSSRGLSGAMGRMRLA